MTKSDVQSGKPAGRLAGKVALVTGASRGLGDATALRFAEEGAHVIAIARTVGGLEDLDDRIKAVGGSATLVPLDLAKPEEIGRLTAPLAERFGRIDVAVLNAAMLGSIGPIALSNPAEWDRVLQVNLTANFHLIRALDPLLRASRSGRLIVVCDAVGREAKTYWNAYAVSKAGLDTLARLYAGETAKTPIRVDVIEPAPMATKLRRAAYPGETPGTQPSPDAEAERILALAVD